MYFLPSQVHEIRNALGGIENIRNMLRNVHRMTSQESDLMIGFMQRIEAALVRETWWDKVCRRTKECLMD